MELQDERSRLEREMGALSIEIAPLRLMKGVWEASLDRIRELEDALREASAGVKGLGSLSRRDSDKIAELQQDKRRLEASLSDMQERAVAETRALNAMRAQADAMRSSTAAEGQTVEKLSLEVGRLQREVEERAREATVSRIDMKRMEAEKEGAEDEARRGQKTIERMEKELGDLKSLYDAERSTCSALVKDKETLSGMMLVQQVNLREAEKAQVRAIPDDSLVRQPDHISFPDPHLLLPSFLTSCLSPFRLCYLTTVRCACWCCRRSCDCSLKASGRLSSERSGRRLQTLPRPSTRCWRTRPR